jgi:hypothetical protein
MRVLLDECVDWRLARDIIGHEVKTARQMGWIAIRNGELLSASERLDVFVTVDRNLSSLPIALIVVHARTNRLSELRRATPQLLAAIATAKPGSVQQLLTAS